MPKLQVGPKNTVALPPEGLAALAANAGDDALIFAVQGVVVVFTVGRDRPYLTGSLGAMAIPEVIQSIFTSLKTGVLTCRVRNLVSGKEGTAVERDKRLFFRDGQVVFAASTDPSDRLGPVLRRHGLVSGEALDRCAVQVGPEKPLGKLLVALAPSLPPSCMPA